MDLSVEAYKFLADTLKEATCKIKTSKSESKQTRTKFSKEEDEKLIKLVEELGNYDWNTISSRMNGRTPRQCRERYRNYLAPSLVNGPWTTEEDALLIQKFAQYGPRWATFVQYFKNRSDVNIKNHWSSISHRIAKLSKTPASKKAVKKNSKMASENNLEDEKSESKMPDLEKAATVQDVPFNNMISLDIIDPFEYSSFDLRYD